MDSHREREKLRERERERDARVQYYIIFLNMMTDELSSILISQGVPYTILKDKVSKTISKEQTTFV